ncbi:TetR/AcrR family transcriptional regulator [Nocardia lasii]|uniref:TetR/AcrR family transcriptional regulator n=1 Tax=Nocardia lasii TaxID=1616107 RepID=A0ABW1JSP0_9NOCA
MTKPPSRLHQRKELLRREIIDTAFDCFAEKGYHATGIADIATRLSIGHGTFYRYFANKRDIVDHVIDEVSARIFGALDRDLEPDSPATLAEYVAMVDRVADSLGRVLLADPRTARLLLFHATGIDDELTERVYGLLDATEILVRQYLEHGVRVGYLRADIDTAGTAKATLGMVVAGLISAIRTPDAASMAVYSHAVRRLLIEGVAVAAR